MKLPNCRIVYFVVLTALGLHPAAAQQNSRFAIDALIDGYFGWNRGQPFNGQNQFHLFDVNANAWSLSLARVALDRDPGPVGLHVELGAGNSYKIMHSFDGAPRVFQYVPQAYLKWKPAALRGVQLDFGKFYTSTGVEVFDTDQNWNYSRSLLFCWAQPGYHFGLRATAPLNSHLTGGVQIVNGWNNVRDANTGKTLGLSANLSWSRLTWSNVYYAGPEKPGANQGWRHLYDTSVMVTPGKRVSFYVNLDYGADRRIAGGQDQWAGVAGAARFAIGPRFAVSSRWEWFYDADGFVTGEAQHLKESTLTGEWNLYRGLITRLEFRRDWSDRATLPQSQPNSFGRSQNTVTLGLLAKISRKR
jgi:hypothetical protein